ncbi:MAG: hypothetical protein AAF713_02175 [Pseudomonadota bacterium]
MERSDRVEGGTPVNLLPFFGGLIANLGSAPLSIDFSLQATDARYEPAALRTFVFASLRSAPAPVAAVLGGIVGLLYAARTLRNAPFPSN